MVHPTRWLTAGVALVILAAVLGGGAGRTAAPGKAGAAAAEALSPRILRNLPYRKVGSPRTSLDLYLPPGAPPERGFPVLVWIHGGAWQEGDKAPCPIASGTGYGYAIASINYRLSGEAHFPAQLEDCRAAIRFLRARAPLYGLDPDHIGAWGESAGGHLAALLGTSKADDAKDEETPGVSSSVQAVCDQYGPTDLLALIADLRQRDPRNPMLEEPNPVTRLLGGTAEERLVAAANPILFVTPDDPPFLILHGDQDPLVPLSQSQSLAARLRGANVEVELFTLPLAGHGGPEFWQAKTIERVAAFFHRHLKPTSPDSTAP